MTTFEIIMIFFGIVTIVGGMIGSFISLKIDITKVQTEVKGMKESLDKLVNQHLKN